MDLNTVRSDEENYESESRSKKVNFAVNLGLFFNIILAFSKLTAGIFGHSRALLADGVNSASDVVYYIVIKIFVKLSGQPPDDEHPFGHHQFESIAALIVGAFVITTGLAIFFESINTLFDFMLRKIETQPIQGFSLWVGCGTIIIKIALMLQSNHTGKKTKNPAIIALAQDHRNDIFSSIGATIGIMLGIFGFPWMDPIAGAVVAILVTKTGIEILRSSSNDLMDSVPSKLLAEKIRASLSKITAIKKIEEIYAHRFGPYLVINITIGINGNLSVFEGDRISCIVEQNLIKDIDMLRKVYVHYHPDKIK